MQNTRKKSKWLVLACLLVVVVAVAIFGLNKPLSASAYQTHIGGAAVYNGHAQAPSGNWYNDNLPVSANPMITVLTHGLNGDASHWSNNHTDFAYDNRSMIEQLRTNAPNGATVFWARMASATTFE